VLGSIARGLALAYLLPSGILLHQMSERQSQELPPSFTVAGNVFLAGDEARRTASELGLAVLDSLALDVKLDFSPDRCALEIHAPRPVTIVDDRGQVTASSLPWANQLVRLGCLPFLFRGEQGGDRLESIFRAAGASFEEAALTFEDGTVAYILGAGENGRGPAGLIVAKGALVPLRLWQQEGGARVEVSFRDYRSASHQGGFPTVIDLRVNEGLLARFRSP
jgi:hypothetical protein